MATHRPRREERAEQIKAFTDRLEWRSAPGANARPSRTSLAMPMVAAPTGDEFGNTLTAADELTRDAESDLNRILVKLPADVRSAVIDDIAARVWQFRLDRLDRSTPNGRAFRSWARRSLPKLQQFERWLSKCPLPLPVSPRWDGNGAEQFTAERLRTVEMIGQFREFIESRYPSRPGHRPLDVSKSDLIGGIGETLWLAGCEMTDSETGVFANVLRVVLHDVGELQPGASVRRSVREAAKYRNHWRPERHRKP